MEDNVIIEYIAKFYDEKKPNNLQFMHYVYQNHLPVHAYVQV